MLEPRLGERVAFEAKRRRHGLAGLPMSPKSRGRPAGRGRSKKRATPHHMVTQRASDAAFRDARRLLGAVDVLEAEIWASDWLGTAWLEAGLGERDPESAWILEMADRAGRRPSPATLSAMHAIRRVAPPEQLSLIEETVESLRAGLPDPAWAGAQGWRPTGAWRAVDVWASERVLMVDLDGDRPHTLMAAIHTAGGVMIDRLGLLEPGAAARWDEHPDADEPPMPISPAPVEEVLADLADTLRTTDLYWPRQDDPDYVALRMLAWQRCRDRLPDLADWEPMPDGEQRRLLEAFVADGGIQNTEATRHVADLIIDYGQNYLDGGPLAWSPAAVMMFLVDFLPRKVALDTAERTVLPDVLRSWLRYALPARGVPQEWVSPVVDAVTEYLPAFEEAFDDQASWGPAKQVVADLTARGIDLTDRQAVDEGIRALNAHRLAEHLHDPGR